MPFEKFPVEGVTSEETPRHTAEKQEKKTFRKALHKWLIGGTLLLGAVEGGHLLSRWREGAFVKPEDYVEYVEKEKPLEDNEKQSLYNKLKYLKERFSGAPLREMMDGDKESKKAKRESKTTEVSGFETLGFTSEEIKNYLLNPAFYPRGWVGDSVPRVTLERKTLVDAKGLLAQTHKLSGEIRFFLLDEDKQELERLETAGIEKQKEFKLLRLGGLEAAFGHELGHANSWSGSNNLTPLERANLLYQTTLAFGEAQGQPDSFRTHYVETISKSDPQIEHYAKVTEWYAELCGEYFNHPNSLKRHPQEFEFINAAIKSQDPDFDPFKAGKLKIGQKVDILESTPKNGR